MASVTAAVPPCPIAFATAAASNRVVRSSNTGAIFSKTRLTNFTAAIAHHEHLHRAEYFHPAVPLFPDEP